MAVPNPNVTAGMLEHSGHVVAGGDGDGGSGTAIPGRWRWRRSMSV